MTTERNLSPQSFATAYSLLGTTYLLLRLAVMFCVTNASPTFCSFAFFIILKVAQPLSAYLSASCRKKLRGSQVSPGARISWGNCDCVNPGT